MAKTTTINNKKSSTPINNSFGHLQPQALDSEKIVLGAIMIDNEAFSVVCELLQPDSFYEPKHKKIYHAINTLAIEENPIDIITVVEQLKKENALSIVGKEYVVELSMNVASSAYILYHANIIKKKYTARQLISFAGNLETKAFDESVDVDELMQETEGSLYELSQKNLKKDYEEVGPVVTRALDIITKAAENKGEYTGIPSGFFDLDKVTSGWQASDLVIIAGRPAMGKTSFALSVAKNITVDNNIPMAFFSLEMSNVQIVNRLISNTCSISGKNILSGQLDEEEWKQLDKNISKLQNAPLFIDDTPGLSIFELRTKARRLAREKDIKIIMIDYLQLMNASGVRFGSRQEEVSNISRSLKGLAKELDIPIIALSQLNRSVDNRIAGSKDDNIEGLRPQLSDLRESGAIEQDADIVMFVHRPEKYHIYSDKDNKDLRGKAQILIEKHRKGATKDVTLKFEGHFTRFANIIDDFAPLPQQDINGSIKISKMNDDIDSEDAPPPTIDDAPIY